MISFSYANYSYLNHETTSIVVRKERIVGRKYMNHSINSVQVQDHYQTLEKSYKKQKREEHRQSGINPEETEVDLTLADIIERFEEAQKKHQDTSEKQKKKIEQDAVKGEDM